MRVLYLVIFLPNKAFPPIHSQLGKMPKNAWRRGKRVEVCFPAYQVTMQAVDVSRAIG